jgi:hypothetical protein
VILYHRTTKASARRIFRAALTTVVAPITLIEGTAMSGSLRCRSIAMTALGAMSCCRSSCKNEFKVLIFWTLSL